MLDKTVYLCLALGFLIAAVLTPVLIPLLKRLKFGQVIREEGPVWHRKKSGTPTMGGIAFVTAFTVLSLLFCTDPFARLGILTCFLFALTGFLDDFIKVVLKRNLGLNEKQKLFFQTLFSVIFLVVGTRLGYITTSVSVPFTGITWELSWGYVIIMTVYMVGFVNAVNLTDGLDGLATSVTTVVALFFLIAAQKNGNHDVMNMTAALIGGLLGFLIYNFNPAKVFMGDTGSLFLGGAVAVFAIMTKLEILLFLVGIIYVIETASVILQVAYFKKTGKRIFLMTPIHHHFEKKGWNEKKIVGVFTFITVLACVIAYFAL